MTIQEQTVPEGLAVGGAKHRDVAIVTTDAGGSWSATVAQGSDYRVRS